MKVSARDGIVIAGAWAVSLALLYNLCDGIFGCGCTWAWGGAASHCDIHHAAPPHCPWCSHGWAGFLWVPALIFIAEAVVVLGLRKRGIVTQMAVVALTYVAVGAAAGWISAWLDGYPRWLGFTIR